MGLLEGKTALITGGSRGIGEGIVLKYAQEGAQIAFTYISSDAKANEVVEKAASFGVKVKAYKSDAANFAQSATLIEEVIAEFGKIDILINNAGITRDNLLLRMSEEQWDEVININLKSAFNLTKNALKYMLKNRSGSIIHMSSVVGVFGNAGQANYAASKAGVIGFSKSTAKEIGSRGVRSNVIAPGFISTDMTHALTEEQRKAYEANIPLKRLGDPEDIANACVFLGSDMSTYITGQTLSVCGGLLD
jgi:3-oxoacyl-[acyl-carrier protein] reductase